MSHVVVVGGGLGGLAASIKLAHAGHKVTVFERGERLGGKMNVIEEQGFLFDTGPTILTYPQVLTQLFSSVGRRLSDYLELVPLDPQWRAFFEDGQIINVWGDRQKMLAEIERVSPSDAAGYEKFRNYSAEMYKIAERYFFWKSVSKITDIFPLKEMFNPEGLKIVRTLDLTSTVGKAINRHFQNPHLKQILEHFMQYVGSSPHQAPAILCSIHHIQSEFGVWYPMGGGMNRVAAALQDLAEEFGVEFVLGKTVERVKTNLGSVRGVIVDGQNYSCDAVVANSDFVRTHTELLPDSATQQKILRRPKNFEPACSGIVLYFGLDRKYDQLWHHDFFFSQEPAREFEDIYHRKVPTQDPTLCVCAPSRTDPSVAPAGCENVYVLVHTPYLQGHENWEEIRVSYRDLIVKKLERNGLTDFRKHIMVERQMTPQTLQDRYLVDRGAIYGITSHGRLRGGFKPPNRSSDFQNLYFAGGSVNPGPGVPMALMSGQIAADCVIQDIGSERPKPQGLLVPVP